MEKQGRSNPTGKRVGPVIREFRRARKIWQPDYFNRFCAAAHDYYPDFYARHLANGELSAAREWVSGIENGRTVKIFHYAEFYDCTAIALDLSWPDRIKLFKAGGMDPHVSALDNVQEMTTFGARLLQDVEELVMSRVMTNHMSNGAGIPMLSEADKVELYAEAFMAVIDEYRRKLK